MKNPRRTGLQAVTISCAILLGQFPASAEPFVPDDPGFVVAELPSRDNRAAWSAARSARQKLEAAPRDLETALAAAKASIELSRAESDQRYLGHAEAALSHWLGLPDPPVEVLVLGGTMKQSRHEFGPAIADLERAVAKAPGDMQAWLTLASVRVTTGDFEGAKIACARLGASLPGAACTSMARGMTGELEDAYEGLLSAYTASGAVDPGLAQWVLGLLAEMAERLGRPLEAGGHYERAKEIAPLDSFLAGAWADYLLDNGRSREAREVLEPRRDSDGMLIRLAAAYRALGEEEAFRKAAEELRVRFEAYEEEASSVHDRELAMYLSTVRRDAAAAVPVARRNFAVQKEATDVRVLAESAAESGDRGAAAELVAWLRSTGYRDARIAGTFAKLEVLAGKGEGEGA